MFTRTPKILFTIACLAMVMTFQSAFAFDTPVTDAKLRTGIEKMGNSFQPVGDKFGCPQFVWADVMGKGQAIALLYAPAGKPDPTHANEVAIVVYKLPKDKKEAGKLMATYASNLLAGYKKNAQVIKSESYTSDAGEPGFFIEYKIGKGTKAEHNAGVFMRAGDSSAAFYQVQSRGKPLAKANADKMRAMLVGTSR